MSVFLSWICCLHNLTTDKWQKINKWMDLDNDKLQICYIKEESAQQFWGVIYPHPLHLGEGIKPIFEVK